MLFAITLRIQRRSRAPGRENPDQSLVIPLPRGQHSRVSPALCLRGTAVPYCFYDDLNVSFGFVVAAFEGANQLSNMDRRLVKRRDRVFYLVNRQDVVVSFAGAIDPPSPQSLLYRAITGYVIRVFDGGRSSPIQVGQLPVGHQRLWHRSGASLRHASGASALASSSPEEPATVLAPGHNVPHIRRFSPHQHVFPVGGAAGTPRSFTQDFDMPDVPRTRRTYIVRPCVGAQRWRC